MRSINSTAKAWYDTLVKQTVQPKAVPIIKLTGVDTEGETVELKWDSNQITSFKIHHYEDPVGRELPSIELEWSEFYFGNVDEHNNVIKYNNVLPMMKVELIIRQYKNYNVDDDTVENIDYVDFRFPTLFLSEKPKVNKNVITFSARDILYFCNSPITWYMQGKSDQPDFNAYALIYFVLMQERKQFRGGMLSYYETVVDNAMAFSDYKENLDLTYYEELFDHNTTKDAVLNFLSKYNSYVHYSSVKNEELIFKLFESLLSNRPIIDPALTVPITLQKTYPTVEDCENISNYNYKSFIFYPFYQRVTIPADKSRQEAIKTKRGSTVSVLKIGGSEMFGYDGIISAAQSAWGSTETYAFGYNPREVTYFNLSLNQYVYTTEKVETNKTIRLNNIGSEFSEENPMITDEQLIRERAALLNQWFSEDNKIVTITCLPNLYIETGDKISIETNLYDGDKRIKYLAIVVDVEIEQKGGMWQKLICHTVGKDANG